MPAPRSAPGSDGDGVLSGRIRIGAIVFAGTLVFALGLMLIEQAGVPRPYTLALLACVIAIGFLLPGLQAATMSLSDWLVAGRGAGALVSAMALSASLISGWGLTVAAGDYFSGVGDADSWLAGFCLAPALAAILIAPYLRKSGAPTPSALIAYRYGGRAAANLALIGATIVGVFFLAAQFKIAAALLRLFLPLGIPAAVAACAALGAFAGLTGGLRAILRLNAIVFAFLATVYLAPLVWLSVSATGNPVPQLAAALGAFDGLAGIESGRIEAGQTLLSARILDATPLTSTGLDSAIFAIFVAIGLAVMPQFLAHFPAAKIARRVPFTCGWAILLTAMVLSAAPAMGSFAKSGLYNLLSEMPATAIDKGADWILDFGEKNTASGSPAVTVCRARPVSAARAIEACGATGEPVGVENFGLSRETVALAMPAVMGLPSVYGALIGAAAIAASLAAAAITGFAVAANLAAGLPTDPPAQGEAVGRRLFAGRVAVLLAMAFAAWLAVAHAGTPQDLLVTAISLSCALLAPVTFGAVWFSAANRHGALAAMLAAPAVLLFLYEMRRLGVDFRPASGDEFQILYPGMRALPEFVHNCITAALSSTVALIVISFLTGGGDARRLDAIRLPDTEPALPDPSA